MADGWIRIDRDESTPWPEDPTPQISTRGKYLRALTMVQLGSGVLFSSFLLVHLIPPAIVAVSGDETSGSAFMLLGKVYYQGALEPLLIYGTITTHLLSSLARRVFFPRSLPSLLNSHSLSGLVLSPLLALHVYVHRIVASSPLPPISSLSPSEMELSFPAYALSRWPLISSLTYGALALAGVWHAWGGLAIAARKLVPSSSSPSGSGKKRDRKAEDRRRLVGVVGLVGIVGVGLVRLAQSAYVPSRVAARMGEVHRQAAPLLYR